MKRVVATFGLLVLFLVSIGASKPQKPVYPLDVDALGAMKDNAQIVPASGWTITIQLKARQLPQGITRRSFPPMYPSAYDTSCTYPDPELMIDAGAFMIFSNPDSYFSMLNPACYLSSLPCDNYFKVPTLPLDETFLEFIPGATPPIYPKTTGYSRRLPGLVVLSDTGIGKAYDANGSEIPGRAYNLASNISSVGYVFRDAKTALPAVTATIASPNLHVAKIEADLNIGSSASCEAVTDRVQYRINGGAIQEIDDADFWDYVLTQVRGIRPTMRIFVVNTMNGLPEGALTDGVPAPPKYLDDLNYDGIVDASDAALAGYTLLSDEQTIPLRVIYDSLYFDITDLDDNGCLGSYVAPAGAGGLSAIPD